jgi:hypothetical protein
MPRRLFVLLRFPLFTIAACALSLPTLAQTDNPTTAPTGLNSLTDDPLLNELASRGLSTLLDRAFDVDRVPPAQRKARLLLVAIGELGRPDLTDAQKHVLIDAVLKRLDDALPLLADADSLYHAGLQLDSVTANDVAMLEYWGALPALQGLVRPVAEAQINLWDRCRTLADQAAAQAANLITNPDDSQDMQSYQRLKDISQFAFYRKAMAQYAQALATDAADPSRPKVATAAADTLRQFDTPEQATIRPQTRITLAKLAALAGDFPTAQHLFDSVIAASATDFPQPPKPTDQYQARYFLVIARLDAKDADAAAKANDDLTAWLNQPSQSELAQSSGVQAAQSVLEYRLDNLKSSLASDPATRANQANAAVQVMQDLLQKQPALRPVIYRLLAANVPHDADLTAQDNLILQALLWQADTLRLSAQTGKEPNDQPGQQPSEQSPEQPDSATERAQMERGINAADILVVRATHPGQASVPPPDIVGDAMLVKALVMERLGRDPEAAQSLLDFVQSNLASEKAPAAMSEAQRLIGAMRASHANDPDVQAAYRRFLPIAIDSPFNQTVFAFEFARLLQSDGKLSQAIDTYRMVPATDRRYLLANYYQMLASAELLNQMRPDDSQRAPLAASVQRLADTITPQAQAEINAATQPASGDTARSILVGTKLAAADLALREQHQPQRAIDLLTNIEPQIAQLPDPGPRMSQMLLIRVQAYLALGKYADSTNELVQLAQRDHQHAGQIVFDMLQNLDDQLDKAQAAGNLPRVRDAARNRAQLTGFLVDWAKNNPNPRIRKYAYGYSVFDAEVQRFAAVQETDPKSRQAGLEKALARFNALDTPQGFEQYQAARTPEQLAREQPHYDPAVRLGVARTEFDMGQYQQSRAAFLDLLNDR